MRHFQPHCRFPPRISISHRSLRTIIAACFCTLLALQAALTSLGISSTGFFSQLSSYPRRYSIRGEYLLPSLHALQFSSGRHFPMFISCYFSSHHDDFKAASTPHAVRALSGGVFPAHILFILLAVAHSIS
ncbi:hypothetical protein B0H10DRAFT_535141 [Mycena sp. CBHHK59/15]|nr:hypothetical protein B0H10DRAFT_535141 [Mycena sp. CBHHK59/15]